MDIQSGMYDMISEMQGVAKQMKVKNALTKKKVEESQITNQYLESVDQ
jgi:hypothetical protein